nr:immunoglobulin heavy chain junction region [Mus musculus]
CTRTQYYFDYW